MAACPDLTGFKALSFDCYGTLVDWEGGIETGLAPVLTQLPAAHPWAQDSIRAVVRFNAVSNQYWRDDPTLAYDQNLARSLRDVAAEAGVAVSDADAAAIGTGPGRWPAFADTVRGLRVLRRHYRLAILSNVDDANIARCAAGALGPVPFDAVYTAERIGSYKPAHANFRYLFARAREELGVDAEKGELLHVAHGLGSDHVPAKELGLPSCWIVRRTDKEDGTREEYERLAEQGKLGFEWKFDTIGDFADEVERQFAAKA